MIKNLSANVGDTGDLGSIPGLGRSPEKETHSSILAWEIHGQRSLVGCSPRGRKESDTKEQLSTQIQVFVQQKLTQDCKAMIFQLKKKVNDE